MSACVIDDIVSQLDSLAVEIAAINMRPFGETVDIQRFEGGASKENARGDTDPELTDV